MGLVRQIWNLIYCQPNQAIQKILFFIAAQTTWRKKTANEINNDIIEVALLSKSHNSNVLVFGIIPLLLWYNNKAIEVNRHLKNKCCKRNICFISYSDINPKCDCNKSGLHLNWKKTNKLVENFYLLWASLIIDMRHR